MAYDAVILGFLVAVLAASITYILCMTQSNRHYHRGWEDAKKLYYDELRNTRIEEEKIAEAERLQRQKAIDDENKTGYTPITSDLLMAYGVNTIGQLPRAVRETYNVKEHQNRIDLDTLMQIEQEVYNDGDR